MNIDYKGYTIEIKPDENADDPREFDENLGIMACAHRRYTLGDIQVDAETFDVPDNAVCVHELWLYDHSGLSLRTYPHGYHQAWDCGKVGYIYTTKSRINKWFGSKKCTPELLERADKAVLSEVETYSMYLEGDCWVATVYDPDGEEVDSGAGYGYDDMIKDAQSAVDADLNQVSQSRRL